MGAGKVHTILAPGHLWTYCGMNLQDVGGVMYLHNVENGNPIAVSEERADATCLRCQKMWFHHIQPRYFRAQ